MSAVPSNFLPDDVVTDGNGLVTHPAEAHLRAAGSVRRPSWPEGVTARLVNVNGVWCVAQPLEAFNWGAGTVNDWELLP